jgi:hypothetical protein
MVSRNKIVTTVITLLLLSVLFSGFTGEREASIPIPRKFHYGVRNCSHTLILMFPKGDMYPEQLLIS